MEEIVTRAGAEHSNERANELRSGARTEEIEVRVRHERHRRWRADEKLRIVQETLVPGTVISDVARRHGIGTPVSCDEILINLRRAAPWNAESGPTRVIGIDEWSRRKGSYFGSTIVDLQRREMIDVLPDRAASSVEASMRNHPDIEYVLRDGDVLYAEGTTKGAPQASRWGTPSNCFRASIRRSRPNWLESGRRPTLSASHRPS